MQISSLNISGLEPVFYRSKQVERIIAEGNPAPRLIYRDQEFFYKIWNPSYLDPRTVYWKGRRCLVQNIDDDGREVLLGFLYGLFDDSVCSAFEEYIYDGASLVGYVTRAGEGLETLDDANPAQRAFVDRLKQLTLASGFAYRDLKGRNVVQFSDGTLSLIDFECPLVLLSNVSIQREERNGSLARFTHEKYRLFLREFLNPSTTDWEIRSAQQRLAADLPKRFRLSVQDGMLDRLSAQRS